MGNYYSMEVNKVEIKDEEFEVTLRYRLNLFAHAGQGSGP